MNEITLMLIIGITIGLVLAIVPIIIWKKKMKCSIWPYFAGAITFFVFVNILESIVHAIVLNENMPLYSILTNNIFLYGLYGGLCAGIFEETGRLFAYKVLLKKKDSMKDSISYGLGHAGCEIIIVLVTTYFVYLVISLFLKTGSNETVDAVLDTFSWSLVAAALFERLGALILHVSLSVLMFIATKRNKMWLYPICILLHALVDFVAVVLYQKTGFIWLTEVVMFTLSVLVAFFAYFMQKKVVMEI